MVIEFPSLPYGYNDLSPHISERTLSTHHAKHHATYVNNTNHKIKGTELEEAGLEYIIRTTSGSSKLNLDANLKQDIFNNAAQVYNHSFFWHCMSPNGGGRATGILEQHIERDFSSFEEFLSTFKDSAVKQFGSGWCWLIWNMEKSKLEIEQTSNAGTPISSSKKKPLLVIDVWEHAYYLDYTNQRKQYVDIFCEHLINWKFVEEKLKEVSV